LKTIRLVAVLLLAGGTAASACGRQTTPIAVVPSAAPDPCSAENLPSSAAEIEAVMRKFDDESALAANVPRSQAATRIAALQEIRREAQDQSIPGCVVLLKQLQLAHMNTVIDTMLAFLSRGDQAEVARGIGVGRQQHDAYVMELARLLGIPAIAATPIATPSAGAAPETGTAEAASAADFVSGFIAVNRGPDAVTLRAVPATAGDAVATLAVGQSARALGGSADGEWIQVVVPDHPYETAWVLGSLVELSVSTP
jgi:hypothetical protein